MNNPILKSDVAGNKSINITIKLGAVMYANAMWLYNFAKLCTLAGPAGKIYILHKFYTLVETGGKWDFKNQKKWQLKKGDTYKFMGKKVTVADLGNIHFGYVGSVLFSWNTLCTGAGIYQIYSGTSDWKYWYSFFDDPRDTACITLGRTLWKVTYNRAIYKW